MVIVVPEETVCSHAFGCIRSWLKGVLPSHKIFPPFTAEVKCADICVLGGTYSNTQFVKTASCTVIAITILKNCADPAPQVNTELMVACDKDFVNWYPAQLLEPDDPVNELAPVVNEIAPEVIGLAPEVIGCAPEVIDLAPEVIDFAPEVTDFMPDVTGFAPLVIGWAAVVSLDDVTAPLVNDFVVNDFEVTELVVNDFEVTELVVNDLVVREREVNGFVVIARVVDELEVVVVVVDGFVPVAVVHDFSIANWGRIAPEPNGSSE